MGFAVGAAFGLLALVPVIVVLYLLKLRRREVVVSSTMLWQKSLQDLIANAPFQRLRNNLLLWLQLLALLLLIFALARPFLREVNPGGRHLIFLIDTSASMQATDVEGGRLKAAVERTRELVRAKAPSDAVMVVVFGGRTGVLLPFSMDPGDAERALERVEATDGRTDATEAFLIAAEVARKKTDTTIYVVSDGVFTELELDEEETLPVEFVRIGRGGTNAGITGLDFRTNPESPLDSQVFVNVSYFGDSEAEPVERTVSYFINETLVDARAARLEPGSNTSVVFTNRGVVEGLAQFELDGEDDLAADDIAYGVLTPQNRRRALLVSQGNYFLERVLSLHPNLDVDAVKPADYVPANDYDVVVFDAVQPPRNFAGAALVIDTTPPVEGVVLRRVVQQPAILDWDRAHPVARFVDFGGLVVRTAALREVPPWARVVMEAAEGPMIATFERGPTRVLYLGFDLFESNWPLLFSFPIFMNNGLEWLLERGGGRLTFQYPTSETVPIYTEEPEQSVRIAAPDGAAYDVRTDANRVGYFAETFRAGFYLAQSGRWNWAFACNVASPEESNIVPLEGLTLGTQEVAARVDPGFTRKGLWKWFLLAGMAVLGLEWWLYTRRAWM